ncbi:imidazoleglycerol-phosphate dehydratase HisB [Gottfriedia acidiceleris]|uniref:imidazoleglycerol-phosphate dehydratase HisB n=1 Tax=Gottfriedia acidiceleris TaxID=371036 RepID=UPI002E26BC3D|nr:imidazoleglycerol-phosphate dehydratase HisB [Gottfriedia acidiceleris]
MRTAMISRQTNETNIRLTLNLDGDGENTIQTGIGFLDHMLTLFSFHSGINLEVFCEGDLEVDDHHTTEDVGIALGKALLIALDEKVGINRYGSCYIPMDETLARVVVDFSGRPYLVYNDRTVRERIGMIDTQNFKEFFKALSSEARMNCHMEVLYGENDHHKIEALFKAFGRAVKQAVEVTSTKLPSTKGML